MSTTLTNGLKLPDKGSVDWYADMQNNYAILDGAVGTIAEHTTALAGKAPAVHTHTKADITDLFNSANKWTEENTFTANNINFKRPFTLGDSSYNICRLQYQDASLTRWGTLNFIHNTDNSVNCDLGVVAKKENATVNVNASIRLTIKPDNSAELIPLNNNKINLGSSSYQWNNLYAKRVNTQSVNGVNPGALSLPKGYTEEGADKDYINIASVIQTLDGTIYNYTVPDNGWICVRAEQAKQIHVTLSTWYFGQSISHPTGSTLIVSVPFRKNDQITLKVNALTLQYARFYPMQGNV